jgi:hypothetical protein
METMSALRRENRLNRRKGCPISGHELRKLLSYLEDLCAEKSRWPYCCCSRWSRGCRDCRRKKELPDIRTDRRAAERRPRDS